MLSFAAAGQQLAWVARPDRLWLAFPVPRWAT